jgi:Putative peptidoglycan binding domain
VIPGRPADGKRPRRVLESRWRGVALALVAIAAVAVAIGVIINDGGSGSSNGASGSSARDGAATVRRRNLVATDTESGTLGYAESHTVYDRLSGTVTSLPSVGRVIRSGQTLYDVADEPVVLFNGATPAYRDLSSSDSAGPDILELNRDLKALGFDSGDQITADDIWQPATTDAVEIWQGSLGQTETGVIVLGQIVFLPGSQRITVVDTVLGSTGQSAAGGVSGSGSGGASSAATTATARSEFIGLTTTTATRPVDNSPAILQALKALLRAETTELKKSKSSASGSGSGAAKGSGSTGGAAAQAILETASTKLVVSVQLAASMRSEAVVGERVTVEMPDGSTVKGRVTQVSSVAQASASSSSNSNPGGGSGAPSATIPVTVALSGHHRSLAGLDQAAVSVNFVQQQAKHVLSVPVTALLATAGGGYDVQQAGLPHGLIAVAPGLFAAGYVQISGAGVYAGLRVTDSQG